MRVVTVNPGYPAEAFACAAAPEVPPAGGMQSEVARFIVRQDDAYWSCACALALAGSLVADLPTPAACLTEDAGLRAIELRGGSAPILLPRG